jgi:uroporphyrinogen-III decarboxylase
MMRQAGRYLKEYRDIRQKFLFWICARTWILPQKYRFNRCASSGVDAVIFFSDILIPWRQWE